MKKEFLPVVNNGFSFSSDGKGTLISLDAEKINMFEFFSEDNLSQILELLSEEALELSEGLDASSEASRKSLKSIAFRFRQTKTYLDGMGKDFLAGFKEKAKILDNGRKSLREGIDDIVSNILEEVTEFEAREERRINTHKENLENLRVIRAKIENASRSQVEEIQKEIEDLQKIDFQEFSSQANSVFEGICQDATDRILILTQEEEERKRIELENQRIKAERDEAMKREAAEKARQDAERKATLELERERKEAEKKQADELARVRREAEEKAAAELAKAKKEADEKAEAERKKAEEKAALELEKVRKEAEEKAREEIEKAKVEKEKSNLENLLAPFPDVISRENAESAVYEGLKEYLGEKTAQDLLQIISAEMIPHLRIVP